jgi:hypothetical protein
MSVTTGFQHTARNPSLSLEGEVYLAQPIQVMLIPDPLTTSPFCSRLATGAAGGSLPLAKRRLGLSASRR